MDRGVWSVESRAWTAERGVEFSTWSVECGTRVVTWLRRWVSRRCVLVCLCACVRFDFANCTRNVDRDAADRQ